MSGRIKALIIACCLLAAAGLLIAFFAVRVCEGQPAGTGDQPGPIEVCRAMTVTDPPVVVGGLILLALLGALYGEVSGFGITLKRQVAQAKQDAQTARGQADDARDRVAALESTVLTQISLLSTQVQQSQLSNQSQNSQQVTSIRIVTTGGVAQLESVQDTAAPGILAGLLDRILRQPALVDAGYPDAVDAVRGAQPRPPRVAIVGPGLAKSAAGSALLVGAIPQSGTVPGAVPASDRFGLFELSLILALEPTATIFPVAVLDENRNATTGRYAKGISAALAWNPDVLLLAAGGGVGGPGIDEHLADAAKRTVLVTAAGNDAQVAAVWPATNPAVLSVAALAPSGELAIFSNHGPQVELAAPGVDVLTLAAVDKFAAETGLMSGTSVSAAVVAGLAAVLLARTTVAPRAISEVLRSTVRPGPVPIVDPVAALTRARASTD